MSAHEHQSVANVRYFHPLQPMANSYRRGTTIALMVTIFLHVGLLLSMPETLLWEPARNQQPASFEIVLDELEAAEETPSEPRYVEANPDVPENPPDATDQYSFRDQQAADESQRAIIDGEPDTGGEEDSQKIVESPPLSAEPMAAQAGVIGAGDAETEETPAEASVEAEPVSADVTAPTRAPADAFPFDDPEADGDGVRLDPGSERMESEDRDDGAIPLTRPEADATVREEGPREEARPQPRPRPRLAPDLVEAPLRQSQGAAMRRGEVAVDATFSAFGEYQQQLIIAVQRGWFQEIEFFQPLDAAVWVHIRFVLQADGTVRDLRVVESTASELATFLCTAAIEKRSPFRPWTREMVEVFGEEQTLNFRFFYR